jgi:four helix bundle protein
MPRFYAPLLCPAFVPRFCAPLLCPAFVPRFVPAFSLPIRYACGRNQPCHRRHERAILAGMTFENLRVHQAAELMDDLVVALVATIPRGYARDIDQLKRASASVPYNIAEANGCKHPGRKAYHLEVARGSADETRSILRRLVSRGALTQKAIERPCALTQAIAKMLTSWLMRLT